MDKAAFPREVGKAAKSILVCFDPGNNIEDDFFVNAAAT